MVNVAFWCLLVITLDTDYGFGQSLSRLKNVTMSSRYSDWVGSRAVDGNYSRKSLDCNCCAATNTDRNFVDQWMEIDLGETTEFSRIIVYGQNSGTWVRQNLIGLAIHLDGSDTSIALIEDTGQGYVNFYHFDLGQKYWARRIKLLHKGSNKVLVICEADVFNDSNISKGKEVTAISTHSTRTPSHAVDGDMRRDADVCLCCAATKHHSNPWMKVDLGDEFMITYIQMYGRTDKQPTGQSFSGMTVAVDDEVIQTLPTSQTFISYYEVFPSPEKIGRNVKFTLNGDGRLITMCEVVIYGERVISHRKPAQISSQWNAWAASRAVDGDYRTDPRVCHCCTATEYQQDPWLRVDLEFEHRVSKVVIYGRTDGTYDGQNFAGMTISLDKTVVHTIPTVTNWINFYQHSLPSVRVARSVKLTLVGGDQQLLVCQLLVYGDCREGYYGNTCATQCHCEGTPCHTLSGICPSGRCKPGYKTETCSKFCDAGKYGTNCRETCGHCRDGKTCNPVNGYCTGCADGYSVTDKTCKTECPSGQYGRDCGMRCGFCKNDAPCHHFSGMCADCKNGTYVYGTKLCNKACEPHTYGNNCTGHCGNCRDGMPCNRANGSCLECEDGYTNTDSHCNTKCPNDTYGQNCQHICGMCAWGEICDGRTGKCPIGCSNGYLGEACLQRSSQDEEPETTISLPVYIGSMIACSFVTLAITLTIVFWKLRRIQLSRSNREEAGGPVPSAQSEAASNYDALQLSNIRSESDYSELQ